MNGDWRSGRTAKKLICLVAHPDGEVAGSPRSQDERKAVHIVDRASHDKNRRSGRKGFMPLAMIPYSIEQRTKQGGLKTSGRLMNKYFQIG